MQLSQVLAGLEYTLVQGSTDTPVSDIYYDSRKVSENGLFVCIVGTQRDSHEFAQDVVAKGAKTLVIEHDQAKKVALCGQNKKPYLTVTMEAPLFGIWSPPGKNAPFICIEPWYGRCDREGYKGELRDREWENVIAPGEVFRAEYQIQIAIEQ